MKTIATIIGTRPEIIKMAPVIQRIEQTPELRSLVVSTGQHLEMSRQFFGEFGITPTVELEIMKPRQSLAYIHGAISASLDPTLAEFSPDAVLIQGDTTTAFVSGLIAFYQRIPVGHVEAGLRTNQIDFPFPEELNRQMVSRFASLNFAPTLKAKSNLLREGVAEESVFLTGNTIVDAINRLALDRTLTADIDRVLVTAHRRENLGEGIHSICRAIRTLHNRHPHVEFVFPVHPNPKVREVVWKVLGPIEMVKLVEPLGYRELMETAARSTLILTDSGGLQEEAPSLKKPVLVLRNETERPEVIDAGAGILVGTDEDRIVAEVSRLLQHPDHRKLMTEVNNPFGDGLAANRITDALLAFFNLRNANPTEALEI